MTETNAERLEGIKAKAKYKNGSYFGGYLSIRDTNWLIEQAERARELEEELKESQRINSVMDGNLVRVGREIIDKENERAELQWQIDRMREALEFYADAENYVIHEGTDKEIEYWFHVHFDEGDKARQALERLK